MASTDIRTDSRTIEEATLDVRFGQHYNDLNARLYRRLDFGFGFVGLFGGTGAFVAALGEYRTLGLIAGAVLAASAVIERLVRPVEKAVEHDACRLRFADLDARIEQLALADVERELKRLQSTGPSGFHALKIPAYNVNLIANGRPDFVLNESRWAKFLGNLA
jgi:hypothetical protein